jgi:hypothetical protein
VIKGRSSDMVPQLSWPFIGREDELEWVAAARRDPKYRGVMVSGAAGGTTWGNPSASAVASRPRRRSPFR